MRFSITVLSFTYITTVDGNDASALGLYSCRFKAFRIVACSSMELLHKLKSVGHIIFKLHGADWVESGSRRRWYVTATRPCSTAVGSRRVGSRHRPSSKLFTYEINTHTCRRFVFASSTHLQCCLPDPVNPLLPGFSVPPYTLMYTTSLPARRCRLAFLACESTVTSLCRKMIPTIAVRFQSLRLSFFSAILQILQLLSVISTLADVCSRWPSFASYISFSMTHASIVRWRLLAPSFFVARIYAAVIGHVPLTQMTSLSARVNESYHSRKRHNLGIPFNHPFKNCWSAIITWSIVWLGNLWFCCRHLQRRQRASILQTRVGWKSDANQQTQLEALWFSNEFLKNVLIIQNPRVIEKDFWNVIAGDSSREQVAAHWWFIHSGQVRLV